MTTTRTLAALAGIATIGILGACAAPADTSEPATASATASSATASPATVEREATPSTPMFSQKELEEAAYLGTVEKYTYPSEEEALLLGRSACALLDQGTTAQQLAMEVILADDVLVPGFVNDDLPGFYGAAIGSMCQQHMWQLEGY